MSQFDTVVQQEIYKALTATPNYSLGLNFVLPEYYESGAAVANSADGLMNIPIYDSVPQANSSSYAAFPYVTIGEDIFTDMSTDTELIQLCSITIHTWSRYSGRSEIKRIQGYIYDLLNRRRIEHPEYRFININQVTSQSQMESDGETRHGIQTFNLIIEEL